MVTAIVLIKTDKSSIPETAETLAALEGVGSVYSVTGAWDLVAMVKVRRYEDLADVIADQARRHAARHTENQLDAF